MRSTSVTGTICAAFIAVTAASCSSGTTTDSGTAAPSDASTLSSASPDATDSPTTPTPTAAGKVVTTPGTYTLEQPVTKPCTIKVKEAGKGFELDFGDASIETLSFDPLVVRVTDGNPTIQVKKGWTVTSKCGPLIPAG